MSWYYYVTSALPPLSLDVKPELSFQEVRDMLVMNGSKGDLGLLTDFLRLIDLSNIRALWMGTPFDARGNLSSKELEEALLSREGLPEFVNDFLHRYDSMKERLRFFSLLYASFYKEMEQKITSGFLRKYFTMEREMRLVLTALRAKRFKKDIVRELQFEAIIDPFDALTADMIAQKDAADYSPPQEYEELKTLFVKYSADPKQLHKALLEYQFKKIEEMEEGEHFSIDKILAYMARLFLVESWQGLDQGQATELLSKV